MVNTRVGLYLPNGWGDGDYNTKSEGVMFCISGYITRLAMEQNGVHHDPYAHYP